MSGFSADWLAAREPVDLRARNADVRRAFTEALAARRATLERPLRVLDLGAGTGATLRALAAHLPPDTGWRFAEHDPVLIARALELADRDGHAVEAVQADLSQGLDDALLDGVDAVTTSAFLDLVSAAWIDGLAEALARHRLPFLAMLTFDGRQGARPSHPLDAAIEAAMQSHQGRDKGFGPALGPGAHGHALAAFAAAGLRTHEGRSDWEALPGETVFQTLLVEGWAQAARETGLDDAAVGEWLALRRDQIAAGGLVTMVGHHDLAALPT